MPKVCVVYLVRSGNRRESFDNFLRSYQQFPSGIPHQLLVVFKGFQTPAETLAFENSLARHNALFYRMSDRGFDLRAYALAAREFDFPYFCFFNSHSQILAEDWLEKMFAAIRSPGVGIVGLTASYESMVTIVLTQISTNEIPSNFSQKLWTPVRLMLCRLCFKPFPNPHVRTNGILIARETMRKFWRESPRTKRGAYLFETGKNSLTRRLLKINLKPLIVDRKGQAFEMNDWHLSDTFRQGNQHLLMVSDNQTRQYDSADVATQRYLSSVSWGQWSRPANTL